MQPLPPGPRRRVAGKLRGDVDVGAGHRRDRALLPTLLAQHHVDHAAMARPHTPHRRATQDADRSSRFVGENRGGVGAPGSGQQVADGVDPHVHPMQAGGVQAVLDLVTGQAGDEELLAVHPAVLPSGEAGDDLVGMFCD